MISEQMDALRERFAGCDFLALADIGSRTVLSVSAAQKPPQEKLDAYCAAAAELFAGKSASVYLTALQHPGEAGLTTATILTDRRLIIFVRSPVDVNEAMLCGCDPTIDVGSFIQAMGAGLARIAETE